ncbi:MAG: fibro-slime domain-containing protein, partial [Oscillospiraceae bacterium]|nr:fibro-slime domain-containing protein [Oscillospiraceae bacterium]
MPITFHIRGDDDIWVFIDGKLVLDAGGDHGEVEGTINFADKVATVSKVKSSWGSSTSGTDVQNSFSLDPGTDHVMTIFYLERGMWGSNLMMDFNFPFELPQPELYNLTVTEEIYGEAPRTDEFTFTIYIDNTDYDLPTEYEVVGSRFGDGEKIVFEPLYRPQSLEDMSGGALVATFTLGHEERITIKGFPDHTEYEIVQSGGIPKYETKVNGTLK